MKRFTALLIIAAMLVGCAGRKPNIVPVPGCNFPAKVFVPEGCYTQALPNGVEVRCKDSTTIYKCRGKGPEADPAK